MNARNFLKAILIVFIITVSVNAQIPRTISFQGVLKDGSGENKDGAYSITFSFYDSETGGTKTWHETKPITVSGGLFSTLLGDTTPFDSDVKFDRQYWLGIQILGEQNEFSPRIPLSSVGYSLSSARADTAIVAMSAIASGDTTWQTSGADVYRTNGNVGIGTTEPDIRLVVNNGDSEGYVMRTQGVNGYNLWFGHYNGYSRIQSDRAGIGPQTLSLNTNGGNVGIGTTNPRERLSVAGNLEFKSHDGQLNNVAGFKTTVLEGTNGSTNLGIWTRHLGNNYERIQIAHDGDVGIGKKPTTKLDIAGHTKTEVLEITGGSDLAEPFEISNAETLPPGSLVVIDPQNPGKLMRSTQPYDKRVAGILSGAGGVNPGLILTQESTFPNGQHVALTGKVYALATSLNGSIEPGDLLTTSSIAGRAMKATEEELWDGAIIGKAMSSLKEGKGLVLVLVNLQ